MGSAKVRVRVQIAYLASSFLASERAAINLGSKRRFSESVHILSEEYEGLFVQKQFLALVASFERLSRVRQIVQKQYAKLYHSEPPIVVKRFRDCHNCDLDDDYMVGEVLDDNDILMAVCGSAERCCEGRIAHTAALPLTPRPSYQSLNEDGQTVLENESKKPEHAFGPIAKEAVARNALVSAHDNAVKRPAAHEMNVAVGGERRDAPNYAPPNEHRASGTESDTESSADEDKEEEEEEETTSGEESQPERHAATATTPVLETRQSQHTAAGMKTVEAESSEYETDTSSEEADTSSGDSESSSEDSNTSSEESDTSADESDSSSGEESDSGDERQATVAPAPTANSVLPPKPEPSSSDTSESSDSSSSDDTILPAPSTRPDEIDLSQGFPELVSSQPIFDSPSDTSPSSDSDAPLHAASAKATSPTPTVQPSQPQPQRQQPRKYGSHLFRLTAKNRNKP